MYILDTPYEKSQKNVLLGLKNSEMQCAMTVFLLLLWNKHIYVHVYSLVLADCLFYSAGHFEKDEKPVSYIQDTDTSQTLPSELLSSLAS